MTNLAIAQEAQARTQAQQRPARTRPTNLAPEAHTGVATAPAESRNATSWATVQIFTPEVINDIHIKSELGRYRMRGFSLFKKIPHWDDLTFLPGTLTRFVIEGYREKCETKTVIGPTRQAADGARHPGLCHRHELRRAVLRGQDRAGPRRHHGGLGHLLGRGRHDPRRAALFDEVVLSVHPVALRLQPASSAAGRCLRVLHRPGLQGRARRPSDGPEGDRPGGRDALAAGRHRPALAGAPSRLARARRSGAQDRGDARGDQLGNPDPAQARRGARL